MKLRCLLVVALLPMATTNADAQVNPLTSLTPATRVRIRNPGPGAQWIVGRVETAGSDSILVTDAAGTVHRFRTSSVVWADTLAGVRRRTSDGVAIGFFGGFGIGFGVAAATSKPCEPSCFIMARGTANVLTGVVFGLLGAMVGAVAGHDRKADVWNPLELPKAVRPTIRSSRGGLSLGAAIRF